MLDSLIDKLIELSKLDVFVTDDHVGRILFVLVLIVIVVGIIMVLKQLISCVVAIWSKTCNSIERVSEIKAEVAKEEIRNPDQSQRR